MNANLWEIYFMEGGPKDLSIADLAKALGTTESVIRSLGRNAALSQLGELYGHDTTRCDADAHQSDQYTGDLVTDFHHLIVDED
jgi:hypothetical protein